MDLNNDTRELIINLQDVESKVAGLSKELLALFVEVDNELVDVLVYAVREHFAVIPYWGNRIIKVTLRNILRHEVIGDTTLRMSLFNSFEGSLEQTLYLDGREKFKLHGQGEGPEVPNVKIVYEWRDGDADPEKEEYDEVKYTIEQAKASHIETEDRIREVEHVFTQFARNAVEKSLERKFYVEDFKEVTDQQHEKSKKILEGVEEFSRKEDENFRKDTGNLNDKVAELEAELRALENSITEEQRTEKTLEQDISSYSAVKDTPSFQRNKDARYKKKEEVAAVTIEISEKVLSGLNKAKEDNLLWGLGETESKITQFDDIFKAQGKTKDKKLALEGVKAEVRDAEGRLAKKEFDLDQLEKEGGNLANQDRDLAMKIREAEDALKAMLADRQDASDRGKELEDRTQEFEKLLGDLEAEVNELKASSEAQGDSPDKDLFKNFGKNNPEILRLQEELDEAERGRDEALNNLEAMEGAWVESIVEVSTEAENLSGDNKDSKFKKDVQLLLKDILEASNRSADMYKILETTDQKINTIKLADDSSLAAAFAKDVKMRNTRLENEDKVVVDYINEGVSSLEVKIKKVEEEQGKIPPLQRQLEDLLKQRDELQMLYEELLYKKEVLIKANDEAERKHQRDLAEYERKIEEMNREIVRVKSQIESTTQSINNLRPQIDTLQDELETWYDKIKIKREIIRKRKLDDEIEDEYIPVPGDRIDELIANYKQNKTTLIPIKRIEEGQYMFATMRAEVTPDAKQRSKYTVKLMRTGKKYDLDNFIRNEADKELEKLDRMNEDQEIVVDESEKTVIRKSPNSPARGSAASTHVVTTDKITKFRR